MKYPFIKMHGLGNDFVILDQREDEGTFIPDTIRLIADRHFGIGCDQVIIIQDPTSEADVFMRIYNADGQEAGACGNATRCLGFLLADEFKRSRCTIETREGLLTTIRREDGLIEVDMGTPRLEWHKIPLARECDTLHLPIQLGILKDPVAVSMGNPHMVFFVKDVGGVDLYNLGQQLTNHEFYPEKANVEIVEVLDRKTLRVRIYERGTGITLACATGASASVVAAHRRGLIDREARVILDGGSLDISYQETVRITGPVAYAFEGTFDRRLFEQAQQKWPTVNPETTTPFTSLPLDAV